MILPMWKKKMRKMRNTYAKVDLLAPDKMTKFDRKVQANLFADRDEGSSNEDSSDEDG